MIILIDTREQIPFRFSPDAQTQPATLPVGDYSILGLEEQVIIERKSLSDLLKSITHDRDRFVRELRQFRAYRLAVLMIEATWFEVTTGLWPHPSRVTPAVVIGSLMAFTAKYRVVPILAGDHDTAAMLTERLLNNFARSVERDYHAMTPPLVEKDKS
jgi:DNA excision repair protein ERCC-4